MTAHLAPPDAFPKSNSTSYLAISFEARAFFVANNMRAADYEFMWQQLADRNLATGVVQPCLMLHLRKVGDVGVPFAMFEKTGHRHVRVYPPRTAVIEN